MERWSSHIGFILAAVGAAVGIGNIWRFSAVLGQNGGGAYLIPYLIACFVFALPLMILEIAMGRRFRGTVVSSFGAVRSEFRIVGWLLCAIVFLILSYYLVITGWTIAYTVFSVTGDAVSFSGFTGSYQPVLFAVIAVLLTGIVVSAGVRQGIERISIVLIPVCIIILIIMALYTTTLPGFNAGILFLMTPDYSVLLHADLWAAAFGQAFFSLSVGEGILLTYGSYMAKEQDIPTAALIITIADLFVALLAGAVIFPIVFTYGLSPTAGAELAFTTLPLAFSRMPAGQLFAIAFFAVLFFAALTSAVSMLEVCVAAVDEALGWTRKKTTITLTGFLLIITLLPALSYSAAKVSVFGIPLLDVMDETIGTFGLHIAAILLAVAFTWFLSPDIFWSELGSATQWNRIIFFLCKYVIPASLMLTIGVQLVTGIGISGISGISGSPCIDSLLRVEGIALIAVLILVVVFVTGKLRKA
jgi:NSS family neurotransmitter:Na+ symporter